MAKIEMPTSSISQGGQPKKKLGKVTTGNVTVRQQSEVQKLANQFLNDYAIPMLKNGVWSLFSSALSLMIFGEDRSRSTSNNNYIRTRNSYEGYYDSRVNQNRPNNQQRMVQNWQNLTSDSRADMDSILDQMKGAIVEYGQVSIGDLYDLAGITANYTDNKYGWHNLDGAYVKAVPGGYSIVFPKPVALT